jgi:hypothetical protein
MVFTVGLFSDRLADALFDSRVATVVIGYLVILSGWLISRARKRKSAIEDEIKIVSSIQIVEPPPPSRVERLYDRLNAGLDAWTTPFSEKLDRLGEKWKSLIGWVLACLVFWGAGVAYLRLWYRYDVLREGVFGWLGAIVVGWGVVMVVVLLFIAPYYAARGLQLTFAWLANNLPGRVLIPYRSWRLRRIGRRMRRTTQAQEQFGAAVANRAYAYACARSEAIREPPPLPEQQDQKQLPVPDQSYAKQVPETKSGLAPASLRPLVKKASMKRTLIAVGIALIGSLLHVPHGNSRWGQIDGWSPFWDAESILVTPLILQTVFAAVVAAILVNIRWRALGRAWRTLSWLAASVVLALAIWFGFPAFQQEMKRRAESEEWAARGDINSGKFDSAKQHLLNAADYWWWKGWWDGARDARERAFDEQRMKKQAAVSHAQNDEARARELLRGEGDIFDAVSLLSNNSYPSDDAVIEAKRLLLDAAENWNTAGDTAEEQRLRAWENNVKTERDIDPEQWKRDEAICHEPFQYRDWKRQTNEGQTFLLVEFKERHLGDRKKEVEAWAKAYGAKRYMLWEHHKWNNLEWVQVVFYK